MPNLTALEKRAAISRAYYAKPENAIKNSARHICRRAIESGKLVRQPCEQCGKAKTEAHHDDYSKPLDVRWLCKHCHSFAHRKTHCIRGHALTDQTTSYRYPPGRGMERVCLECRKIHSQLYAERKSQRK